MLHKTPWPSPRSSHQYFQDRAARAGVRHRLLKLLVALAAGAATVLSFGPFNQQWIGIAGPALLFYLWLGAPPRFAFVTGICFGVGLFGVGVSWTYVSMNVYGNMPGPLAGLAAMLFVLLLALFPAAVGALQAYSNAPRAARLALVIPTCWTLVEWVRSWILTGFPWLSLGYGQIDSALSGMAPWLGVFGVTLFSTVFSGLLVVVFIGETTRQRIAGACAIALLWAIAWNAGGFSQIGVAGTPLRVALVQGNVPLERKWQPSRQEGILNMYLELSDRHPDRDLIVWPEAALPLFLDQLPATFWRRLEDHPADFVTGILERSVTTGSERSYNSVVGVAEDRVLYRKAHLVPFGEFLPFPALFSWIIDYLDIPMSDFSEWEGGQRTMTIAGVPAAVSICYEDAFQDEMRRALGDAEMMINVSEDSWFGDSLAPHQRLDMARMRTLENGRPMIRAGNSGISAVIDHGGNVIARAPQFQRTVLLSEVQPTTGRNPFVIYGSWPVVIACAIVLLISLVARRR